jgi:hypothetical protein
VLNVRNCTFSPPAISLASLSPHSTGISESASAYTSTLKVQPPVSSCGRNVTDAVICRKMAAISAWISVSVLSGAGEEGAAAGDGVAFSSSAAGVLEDLDLEGLPRIWTCWEREALRQRAVGGGRGVLGQAETG